MVDRPDRFSPGLRRFANHDLARLYAIGGRPQDAQRAREKAGDDRYEPPLTTESGVGPAGARRVRLAG